MLGVTQMAKDLGMDHSAITQYLIAHDARDRLGPNRSVSSDNMVKIASVAKVDEALARRARAGGR